MTAIKNAEVSGDTAHDLSDEQVQAIVRTEAKRRQESAQIYADAGRPQQAERERAEAQVLLAYLPAQLDEQALAAIVDEEYAAAGGNPAMGALIKAVRTRVGQQASTAVPMGSGQGLRAGALRGRPRSGANQTGQERCRARNDIGSPFPSSPTWAR
jgi:uncharacterized protein YqeY